MLKNVTLLLLYWLSWGNSAFRFDLPKKLDRRQQNSDQYIIKRQSFEIIMTSIMLHSTQNMGADAASKSFPISISGSILIFFFFSFCLFVANERAGANIWTQTIFGMVNTNQSINIFWWTNIFFFRFVLIYPMCFKYILCVCACVYVQLYNKNCYESPVSQSRFMFDIDIWI